MPASNEFNSWFDFLKFADSIRNRARYIHEHEVRQFLAAVAASAERRVFDLVPGKTLWRAQVGHVMETRQQDDYTYKEPVPYRTDRMKPLHGSAHEGRVNSRGIPCLYTSSHIETAVAEVRPRLGALVSVAELTPLRTLRLVNCLDTHDGKTDIDAITASPEAREIYIWQAIGFEFSKPVGDDLAVAEYAPTQVLAEKFKELGYDGVVYNSRQGTSGINFALFDIDAVDIRNVRLCPVKSIVVGIGEVETRIEGVEWRMLER